MSGRVREEFGVPGDGAGWILDETLPIGDDGAAASRAAHDHDDDHHHGDGRADGGHGLPDWLAARLAGADDHGEGRGRAFFGPELPDWLVGHVAGGHADGDGHARDGLAAQLRLGRDPVKLSDSLGVTGVSDTPSGSVLASIQGDYAYGDGHPGTIETIRYAFGSGQFTEGGQTYNGQPWSEEKKAQFRAALATWEAVANIRFVEVADPADADIAEYLLDSSDLGEYTLGYHYGPYSGSSIGAYNVDYWNLSGGAVADPGGYFFTTLVHEIGHALGLGHPHDTSLGSSVMDGVSAAFGDYGTGNLNQGVYTVMSYNKGFEQTDGWLATDAIHAGTKGPGALDIAAIQNLYGANTGHASGNTIYRLPDDNGAGTGYETIWDTGGIDTIVYAGARNVVIDLRDASLAYQDGGGGFVSSAAGVEGGFTIADGATIERIRAGSGDDWLAGNHVRNVIVAGAGDDKVFGLGGNDAIYGGHGKDVLRGNAGNDTLSGGPDNDVVIGGHGNDAIVGGRGYDILVGGPGADRFVFNSTNGKDIIRDFEGGLDRLDFRWVAGVDSVDDLDIREFGDRTVILFNDDRVVLQGVAAAEIDHGDYIF